MQQLCQLGALELEPAFPPPCEHTCTLNSSKSAPILSCNMLHEAADSFVYLSLLAGWRSEADAVATLIPARTLPTNWAAVASPMRSAYHYWHDCELFRPNGLPLGSSRSLSRLSEQRRRASTCSNLAAQSQSQQELGTM